MRKFEPIHRGSLLAFAAALALLVAGAAPAGEVAAGDDASSPFIVKIHADWCGTCTRMNPTFEELDAKVGGGARIVVLDVTDKDTLTASQAEADRLGIRAFFDEYKGKTGTVGVLDGSTRETVVVMKGETDVSVYEAAVVKARGESAS